MNRAFLTLLALVLSCHAAEIYDPKKSYVTYLGKVNWENQVNKIRQTTKQVSLVQFYKSNDYDSAGFVSAFESIAKDYKGMLRVGAVDCNQEAALCEKEGVKKWPTFRVFPPMPQPALDFEDQLDQKKLSSWAIRFIQNNVIEVGSSNADTFINDSPSVPKVLLFTEKPKGTPLIFKALSVAFSQKLFFGIVRKEDNAMLKRYNVKTFPQLLVVKATERKPIVYTGEIKYQAIFDFVNIYSETFVSGGGSSQDSAATKAWLSEPVPEMHEKSAGDICLNLEGYLCVLVFSQSKPEGLLRDELVKLSQTYAQKASRGSSFKFMWIDAGLEAEYARTFGVSSFPSAVVLNPGRRKRYVAHNAPVTHQDLVSTVEKINSGDSRFIAVKGALPEFSARKWK